MPDQLAVEQDKAEAFYKERLRSLFAENDRLAARLSANEAKIKAEIRKLSSTMGLVVPLRVEQARNTVTQEEGLK